VRFPGVVCKCYKGAGFLAIFAGYVVGALLFLLLQKLKPSEEFQLKSLE
jgi:hypothetical protein